MIFMKQKIKYTSLVGSTLGMSAQEVPSEVRSVGRDSGQRRRWGGQWYQARGRDPLRDNRGKCSSAPGSSECEHRCRNHCEVPVFLAGLPDHRGGPGTTFPAGWSVYSLSCFSWANSRLWVSMWQKQAQSFIVLLQRCALITSVFVVEELYNNQ